MRKSTLGVHGDRLFVLAAVALAAAGIGVGKASADTTTSFPLFVADCVTATQFCAVIPTVTVSTLSVLKVNFTASPGHCSDIIAHIQVDGVDQFVSGTLTPGASTGVQDLGPVSAGTHTVGVLAEGITGGCNTGFIGSWSGTLDVTILPVAVPTLSEWAQLILLALLIGGGLLALRRRSDGPARPA